MPNMTGAASTRTRLARTRSSAPFANADQPRQRAVEDPQQGMPATSVTPWPANSSPGRSGLSRTSTGRWRSFSKQASRRLAACCGRVMMIWSTGSARAKAGDRRGCPAPGNPRPRPARGCGGRRRRPRPASRIVLAHFADEQGRLWPRPDQDEPGCQPARSLPAADRDQRRPACAARNRASAEAHQTMNRPLATRPVLPVAAAHVNSSLDERPGGTTSRRICARTLPR